MSFYHVAIKLLLLLITFPVFASYSSGYLAAMVIAGFFIFCLIMIVVMVYGLIKKRFLIHAFFSKYIKTVVSVSVIAYLLSIMEYKASPNNHDLLTISLIYLSLVLVLTIPAWLQNKTTN